MRDLSCFGDGSVAVAAASVSGRGCALDRTLQAATTSVYSARLSCGKEILIRVTWTRSTAGAPGLAVAFDDDDERLPSASSSRSAAQQHVLRKKRGSRAVVTGAGTAVCVHWDVTAAEYASCASASPEPSGGDYCLAVVADAELALLLGKGELARRFASSPVTAVHLVSRREQLRGGGAEAAATATAAHATRCRFREGGEEHEVAVRACGGRGGVEGEVRVSIDGEEVAGVRRVGWGFRGNRAAVLGDGEVVDVMWDVHDWWFGRGGAGAQFMVRSRAEKEGRLWMADQPASAPPAGFFLHVQCYRR
ncbi:uncharacterized protein [Lolium perenne]|uniref:uncharacterized protein n=1 Tax=Lolium perenne TaxID=4522 RepID=UPI0021EB366C|nr:uncharacterized protein LOC127312647 [Lolium perenne]